MFGTKMALPPAMHRVHLTVKHFYCCIAQYCTVIHLMSVMDVSVEASNGKEIGEKSQKPVDLLSISSKSDTPTAATMSKRQLKRLAKKEKWLADKPLRRARYKEKQKKRKRELSEQLSKEDKDSAKRPRWTKMCESSCRTRVAVDLAYDHLMSESDVSKTCKQIQRCYAANRRVENPLQFYITNFLNASKEKLVKSGCLNWDVYRDDRSSLECFDKTEIVYLTSESPNVLTILEDSKVYVIGGIVDHNKHKGLCLSLAETSGIGHARLPIVEFVSMKTRKVLSIVHVFELLVNVTQGMSWGCALMETLPKRKLSTLLADGTEDVVEDESD